MKGELLKIESDWVIVTPTRTIKVHKSCINEIKESDNKTQVDYSTLKDFTSDSNGIEYALPIL